MIRDMEWWKLTLSWILRDRRRLKEQIDKCDTQTGMLALKNNLWLVKFRLTPDHWITRDFIKMFDKSL
jgi:hypothetical protein